MSGRPDHSQMELETPEMRERGARGEEGPQLGDHRLYLQFQAFGNCLDTDAVQQALAESGLDGALWADIQDPTGIGVAIDDEGRAFFTQLFMLPGSDG